MGTGSTAIMNILLFQFGDRFYTTESAVYRRQILSSEIDSSIERVNP